MDVHSVVSDVSIIVVNWNGRAYLPGCLGSLPRSAEVIVVDNASTDGSAAFVRDEYPYAIIIANKRNVGFAAANNIGTSQASGDYLLFLNNDTVVFEGALESMREPFERDASIGVVGGRLENPDGTVQCSSARDLLSPAKEFRRMISVRNREGIYCGSTDYDVSQFTASVSGAALMVRRDVFDQVGGWDESYFAYGEDVELCRAVGERGWAMWYEAQGRILHFHGGATKQRGFLPALRGFLIGHRSLNLYLRRHHGLGIGLLHMLLVPVDLIILLGRRLVFRARTQAG